MRYNLPVPLRSLWDDDDWISPVTSTPGGLSVSEDEKNVYVEAALPGLDPKQIEITFEKGIVWIRGEAKEEEENDKKKYYRQSVRSFSYRVSVPGEIDHNVDPQATYKHGVMKVIFPKSPTSQPKKISFKAEE